MAQEKDRFSDLKLFCKDVFTGGQGLCKTHELNDKNRRTLHNMIGIMVMVASYQWAFWVYFEAAFQKFRPLNNTVTGNWLISQFTGPYSFSVATIKSNFWLLNITWHIVGYTELAVGVIALFSLLTGEWLPNRRKYLMLIASVVGMVNSGWLLAGDNIPMWNAAANTNGYNMNMDVSYFGMNIVIFFAVLALDILVRRRQGEELYIYSEADKGYGFSLGGFFGGMWDAFKAVFLNMSNFFGKHTLVGKTERNLEDVLNVFTLVPFYFWAVWAYFYNSFQKFTPLGPHSDAGPWLVSQFSGAYSFTAKGLEAHFWVLNAAWRMIGVNELAIGIFAFLSFFTGEWFPNRRKFFLLISMALIVLNNGWILAGDSIPNWSVMGMLNGFTGGGGATPETSYFTVAVLILGIVFALDWLAKKRRDLALQYKS